MDIQLTVMSQNIDTPRYVITVRVAVFPAIESCLYPRRPGRTDLPRRGRARRHPGLDRRATAALEFVLLAPAMLIMLFGFIATGAAMFSWAGMQNNAQNAALTQATNTTITHAGTATTCVSTLTATQAEYWACLGLPNWATFQATVTENCTSTPNTVTVLVQVASGSNAGLADTYGFFKGKSLSAQAIQMIQTGICS